MTRDEFRPETLEYTNEVKLEYRKSLGQYFTPKSVREKLLNKLPKKENAEVLDPGGGSAGNPGGTNPALCRYRRQLYRPEKGGY